jgi:hypothetical protein
MMTISSYSLITGASMGLVREAVMDGVIKKELP